MLEGIAEGLDNAEIAASLELSEKTVRNHITRVFDKIGVEHRYQAIVRARDAGLGMNGRPSSPRLCGTSVPKAAPALLSHRGLRLKTPRSQKTSIAVTGRAWCVPFWRENAMPKFVIERDIVGAGKLPKQELLAISQKSCSVLQSMGPQIEWVQSLVTDDKIYCLYIAPDEATVRMHAQKGGFPANSVARVRSVIDPTTAE